MNDGLGISTHHDSITGTATSEVIKDYQLIIQKS